MDLIFLNVKRNIFGLKQPSETFDFQILIPKYKKVIPIKIKVVHAIYKPTQSANILRCSELFAIGKSIVVLVI
jgi:hypothetical protein